MIYNRDVGDYMKKITLLLLHLRHGGIEKQNIMLANLLCEKYKVEIISVYSMHDKPAYKLDKRIKVKYLIDDAPNRNEFKNELKKAHIIKTIKEGTKGVKILHDKKKLMIQAIKKLDCDYVLSSRVEFTELLNKYCPKDIVTVTQEHDYIDNKDYTKRIQKAFTNINYLVVMTKGAYDKYSEWLKDNKNIKILIIPNMVEKISHLRSKLDTNTLVAVGRMHPVKGFDSLIEVFKEVKKEIPNAKLNLIGDGDLYDKFKSETKGLNVNMPGMVSSDEVKKYMLKSDLYVMTSLTESFSLVLLEASSVGLPLVAFDVPVGPSSIIYNDINGYLIPNRDIKLMASKIVELLKDREKLNKMSEEAYVNVKKYLPDVVMEKWYNLFK